MGLLSPGGAQVVQVELLLIAIKGNIIIYHPHYNYYQAIKVW